MFFGPLMQIGIKAFNIVTSFGPALGIGPWGTLALVGVVLLLLICCASCLATKRGRGSCLRGCRCCCRCCCPKIAAE